MKGPVLVTLGSILMASQTLAAPSRAPAAPAPQTRIPASENGSLFPRVNGTATQPNGNAFASPFGSSATPAIPGFTPRDANPLFTRPYVPLSMLPPNSGPILKERSNEDAVVLVTPSRDPTPNAVLVKDGVSVLGLGVRKPGIYAFRDKMTVGDAVCNAGTIRGADLSDVRIHHQDGKDEFVDLRRLQKPLSSSWNVPLQRGDTLVILPLPGVQLLPRRSDDPPPLTSQLVFRDADRQRFQTMHPLLTPETDGSTTYAQRNAPPTPPATSTPPAPRP